MCDGKTALKISLEKKKLCVHILKYMSMSVKLTFSYITNNTPQELPWTESQIFFSPKLSETGFILQTPDSSQKWILTLLIALKIPKHFVGRQNIFTFVNKQGSDSYSVTCIFIFWRCPRIMFSLPCKSFAFRKFGWAKDFLFKFFSGFM